MDGKPLTEIERQVLIDLDLVLLALDGAPRGPADVARFIAAKRQGLSGPDDLLERLCRQGFMRFHNGQHFYSLTSKPVPPMSQALSGREPEALCDEAINRIVIAWKAGKPLYGVLDKPGTKYVRDYKKRDIRPETTDKDRVRIELLRKRSSRRDPKIYAPRWAEIVANILLAETIYRGALPGSVLHKIVQHHFPQDLQHITNRRSHMLVAGCLVNTRVPRHGNERMWRVSPLAREILAEENIKSSFTLDVIQELLGS